MWTYSQSTGKLLTPSGNLEGVGYSGYLSGLNNPAMENIHDFGPIPRGLWSVGTWFDDPEKGPMVCHLSFLNITSNQPYQTFGREGFMIHGDNPELNHSASRGCVILGPSYRRSMMESDDKILMVTE